VIHLYSAERAEDLAGKLAQILSVVPDDPFAPEWIAVPTDGMRRWLHLEMARHLGASGPLGGDGVAANIVRAFPGTLRTAVLAAARPDDEPDRWGIDQMVWSLLEVFEQLHDAGEVREFTGLTPGASRFARVRAVADLFDRYHLHRPEMIRRWVDGSDVDGSLQEISEHAAWQPRVWRLLRQVIGEPSPPELFDGLLRDVRDGTLDLGLPHRLVLFGFTSLPGRGFLDLVRSAAELREVHLFLLEPCRFDGTRLAEAWPVTGGARLRLRQSDGTADLVHQPLLKAWGRLPREMALILAEAGTTGTIDVDHLGGSGWSVRAGTTLLERLQDDIRDNVRSDPAPVDATDRSVQFHACYGPMREVQAARDALLHCLAADPDLTEEDILVVCPGLETFAPLIEAAFGPSATSGPGDANGTLKRPLLRYRIADRSIRSSNTVLAATSSLLDLLAGRFEVAPVVDFISSAPVRERFRIDEDDLGDIIGWVADTRVRWGLDTRHRATRGMPESVTGNTWRLALDRLLLGSAVADDATVLTIGDVAPRGVETGANGTLGSLASILGHLAALTEWAAGGRHPTREWLSRLRSICGELFAAPTGAPWEFDALDRTFDEVLEAAGSTSGGGDQLLDLSDIRRLLDGKLQNAGGRPDFFRGGITVTSTTPLRWVPFRIVCLLGLDQEFVGSPAADAADLVAESPQLGDPDPRAESRQSLLEIVLAAREQLIVVRDGHDVRSSHETPRVVPASELFDAVVSLASPDQRDGLKRRLEISHPRHSFDESCVTVDGLVPGTVWSFDRADTEGASARRDPSDAAPLTVGQPIERPPDAVIELVELHAFVKNPVAVFASRSLQISFPYHSEADDTVLPVEPGNLDQSDLGRRLLEARRRGMTDDEWLHVERRTGTLPPGVLDSRVTGKILSEVGEIVAESERLQASSGLPELFDVDVAVADGLSIVGTIPLLLPADGPGPARVRYTRPKPGFVLEAWLDLMVLMAMDPETPWRSVSICRGGAAGEPATVYELEPRLRGAEGGMRARRALAVVATCYRSGMREPLPLFPTFSKSVADDAADGAAWHHRMGWGDGDKGATAFFFGYLTMQEVLALPAVERDPDGSGGRVARWAAHLWDEVEATVGPVPA
jgi:exodeoxyribonuclease V gamma subunit